MMITVINKPVFPKNVELAEIPRQQVFTGRINSYTPRLFMRIGSRNIVPLDGLMDDMWSDCTSDFLVEDYVPVDIEIKIL